MAAKKKPKLRNDRRPETARALAERFKISVRSVVSIWSMDREDYLKNSYSRTQPWKYFGYSRRTWYKRGKPMPPELAPKEEVQTEGQPKES